MEVLPKVLLLDCDGVIWEDFVPLPGALDSLSRIRKLGVRLCLVTNNSSKNREEYIKLCNNIGLTGFTTDDVFTSGIATKKYLKTNNIHSVFVSGFDGLKKDLKESGFDVHTIDTDPELQKVDAVLVAKSDIFSHAELQRAITLVKKYGAKLIGVNPDPNFPISDGVLSIGGGAILRSFEAGCEVEAPIMGKPCKSLFDIVLEEINVSKDDLIMVGDRLMTDIAFAADNGARSILVLSGGDKLEDVEKVPDHKKPTWIKPSLVEVADMFESWYNKRK